MRDWEQQCHRALLTLESATEAAQRAEAADLLHELAAESKERWPGMLAVVPRLLDDPQDQVRRSGVALAALMLEPDNAEQLLMAQLADAAPPVRLEAVGQLADLGRPSTRAALAKALEDPEFHVRFEAARGMATLRHSAGLEVLIEALEQDALRFRTLGALAELGDVRALPAIRKIYRRWFLPGFERTQAAGALAKLGDLDGAHHLIKRARGAWQPDRALAVELCGEVKAPGTLECLVEILTRATDPCSGAAARGLGRLGDVAAIPVLLSTLKNAALSDDLRLDAAEGLYLLQGADAKPALEHALVSLQTASAREELSELLKELL